MQNEKESIKGLDTEEVKILQQKFGKNELIKKKKERFIFKIIDVILEPMFLLLILASVIYFALGEPRDGIIMLVFVIGIITIDVVQEWKTDKTLNALKELSSPHIKVIRNGEETVILSSDLVPGDIMIISEGVKVPADGKIIKCNDLCIDESSLTGESEGVWKTTIEDTENTNNYFRKDYCYSGTLVTQGLAYVLVYKIGLDTEYGKISISVAETQEEKTPLQKQTRGIIKVSAMIAGTFLVLVSIITYFNIPNHDFNERIIESILAGITLAMGTIPEEFPVILTVFLAMGAWRLAKKKSLIRKLPSVETLGSISVLCVDKTGTITKNQMSVNEIWSIDNKNSLPIIMGMACEIETYDSMEKAILEYCEKVGISKEEIFKNKLITEYSFTNELKMMGHVWNTEEGVIIAAKGAPESLLGICNISEGQKQEIQIKIDDMSSKGMRVIACGSMKLTNENQIPESITNCTLEFCGLIGLIDPPRENVKEDIDICNRAGIKIVMITGDNGITAKSIAKEIGIKNCENIVTGDELDNMTNDELKECVKNTNIFSRVTPEHKMRIVKAFKENGEIVAMTGDGVNDAPALKYADCRNCNGEKRF